KEEFIPSDGQLTVYGKMTIPMSFDTGSVLCYSDTIEFDFSDPTLDDVSKLKLFFNYTNNFPLGMFVDVFLLDENKQSLSTKPYQEIYMDRPETYPDGENKGRVKTPKTGEFSIAFENGKANSIDKLKEAHYICVSYRSEKENLDQAPPMRLSTSDKMTVRITCEIDGKIILENK
ncbi:MAG: hypothetical protein LBH32_13215, partial [Dysgonamonadaceae bacterium]|nr:hypothetical protein [Dysgonamonadaceae bacterium]